MTAAPAVERFPAYPVSWHLFGPTRSLSRGPVSRDLLGSRLVAYRTASGRPVVLDAHCSHMGADLGKGQVHGEAIRCPFHGWEYGPDGRCNRLPSGCAAPSLARQTSYPTAERHGYLWVFNAPEPLFPLPFFPDCDPADFVPARPFHFHLDCPWFLIGANSVDLQHFRTSHDRELLGDLDIVRPSAYSCRVRGTFRINGTCFRDRLLRLFGGDQVTLDTSDWCGNLIFTTSTLRKTRSQGMVTLEPLGPRGVRVTVIVYAKRGGLLGRLFGPVQRAIRRHFIRSFLAADAYRFDGARYNPLSLVADDRLLIEYFRWLAVVSHGRPAQAPTLNGVAHQEEFIT